MITKILAFDPGSFCGWASLDLGHGLQRIESGVHKFNLKHGESGGMRFIRFNAWLEEITALTDPDFIVYEQPGARLPGMAARELLYGFVTRIQEYYTRQKIQYTACSPSALKKWATGKGNCKKGMMVAVALKRRMMLDSGRLSYPPFRTDDEADAVLLALWAMEGGYR